MDASPSFPIDGDLPRCLVSQQYVSYVCNTKSHTIIQLQTFNIIFLFVLAELLNYVFENHHSSEHALNIEANEAQNILQNYSAN